jgi:hypothetical protein
MALRNPLVLISGFSSELPPGDLVPGQDVTALASGNAALALASTALASGNDALSLGTTALASGNFALFDASVALASGNAALIDASTALASGNAALIDASTALASGNAGIADASTALASGNAGIATANIALASGNAALVDLGGKYDKTGGPISGPVVVESQSFGSPDYVLSSGVCILNFGVANNFEVVLTSGTTFASPVSASGGQSGVILIRQDSVGTQLASYSGSWSFIGNAAPTLTTTASGVDLLAYYVVNPQRVNVVATLDYGSGTFA